MPNFFSYFKNTETEQKTGNLALAGRSIRATPPAMRRDLHKKAGFASIAAICVIPRFYFSAYLCGRWVGRLGGISPRDQLYKSFK
jgi:hypothetical protein